MKRMFFIVGLAVLAAGSTGYAQDWDARRMAEQAAQAAMAQAMAEKARNDEIMRQQMELERQRVQQEQQLRDLEQAERRARTG